MPGKSFPPLECSGEASPEVGEWDEDEADWLRGKYVLVGVTFTDPDDDGAIERGEYHGRIAQIDKAVGVVVVCEGRRAGETLTLPPVTKCFEPAGPGEYRLRSTGEIVIDPEATATWTIMKPRIS